MTCVIFPYIDPGASSNFVSRLEILIPSPHSPRQPPPGPPPPPHTCMSRGPNRVIKSSSMSQSDGAALRKGYASMVDMAVRLLVDRQTGMVIGPWTYVSGLRG